MHDTVSWRAYKDEMFNWGTAVRSLIAVAAMTVVLVPQSLTQETADDAQHGATITGAVTDLSGRPVAGVPVNLKRRDAADSAQSKTDSAGVFFFSRLQQGTYDLTAEQAPLRSTVTVVVSTLTDRRKVDLMLGRASPGNSSPGAAGSFAQAMEFADKPNFTVAGVTDWTAAGGHGSDVSLRTSEALTRETVTLKPGNKEAAATAATPPDPSAAATEQALRTAVTKSPESFEANRELGKFYLREGRFAECVPFLKTAFRIDPGNRENERDLTFALKQAGDLTGAREHVQRLLAKGETGDLHRLAGEIDESLGDPLSAVNEFELATRQDPSEVNYFEWGSELLLHRAVWQAQEVFRRGSQAHPKSSRMLTALGAALFAGALYDEAALRLCDASDLGPSDSEPYIFMGKIEVAAPNPLPCVEQKLARFAEIEPGNALAVYYHAMAIWKQAGHSPDQEALSRVESMLTKAVSMDPKCSEAYLQLGNLNYSERNYKNAIAQYRKAIEVNPNSSEAHYRLGIAYDRTGDQVMAKQELDLHDKIEKEQAAEVERQRREVKQFRVVEGERPLPKEPQ